MKLVTITAACVLLSGGAAFAQDTPESAAPPPAASEAAPAPAPTSFTDEQIDGFAEAVVKIRDVSSDTTLDQTAKQTKMVSIVEAAGLDPQTFNAIGQAVQSDPALQQKVQLAIANEQGSGSSNQ